MRPLTHPPLTMLSSMSTFQGVRVAVKAPAARATRASAVTAAAKNPFAGAASRQP